MSGLAQPNGPADSEIESRPPDQTVSQEPPRPESSGPSDQRVDQPVAEGSDPDPPGTEHPQVAADAAVDSKPAVPTPHAAAPVMPIAEPPTPVAEQPSAVPATEAPVAPDPDPEPVPEPEPDPDPEVVIADSQPEVVVEQSAFEPVPEPEPDPDPDPVPEPEVAAESGSGTPSSAPIPPPTPVASAPADSDPASSGSAPPPPPSSEKSMPEPSAPGKIVEGVVTQVTSDSVDLLLDDGRPAVINRRNFGMHDEEPSSVLSVGDRAFGAELAREDPKSRVVLSRVWALKRQAWDKLATQAREGEPIRCRVVSASKKGLVVDAGVRGFVPASHLELEAVTDFQPYMGETLELKILEIDPRREKLVLSRRAILQKAVRKERQELMGSLTVGEVRKGRIQSLTDYGAFVDLGGVSGLVHLSELSWYRVAKPADVVKIGDEIDVKILDVKIKKRRISLSIRQTASDPLTAIEVGSIVVGRVSRLVDFGAFVLIEGFEGLVHLSELAEYRVSTPEAVVAPGDEVRVKILSVDPSRRRIELSIRRAAEYQG